MADAFAHGYALLVGVNENHVPGWALPDVAKDIAALAEVLTHPQRCAYPPDHVKAVTGQDATRQGILDGLEWLHEQIQADASGNTTAVIYYTGHGWRDAAGNSYLIPYDIREGQVRSRALRAEDFVEAVSALQPRRLLVVLDCCHAGGMGVKGAPLPAGYVEAAIAPAVLVAGPGAKGLETLAVGRGRAVLSSSTGEQSSYLRQDGRMSIFTYHLVEALTGHAQPQEGATEVLVSDVMSHVWRRVPQSARADWSAEQTPDYQVSGNFPVALLLGGQGLSKGQPAPDPLASIAEAPPATRIDTSGGAYVGGDLQVGGDFVGRDQVVYGDLVRGDKVAGDKIVIDASVHDRHDVHIKAGRDVVYAPDGSRPGPADLPPSEYNLAVVRELLTIALSDGDVTTLAFDHFPVAYNSFGRGMGKDEKTHVLVEYCEGRGRTGELLNLVKARNPGRYEQYAPRLRRMSRK